MDLSCIAEVNLVPRGRGTRYLPVFAAHAERAAPAAGYWACPGNLDASDTGWGSSAAAAGNPCCDFVEDGD